mgnify:CR=1 FL=1
MSIEEAMMGGIVFKGKKDKPKEENKIKTKAKKKTYITGQHGSASAKMKQKSAANALTDIRNDKYSLIACRQGPDGRSHSRLL